jgi:pyruvate formate lyase activating enzyme
MDVNNQRLYARVDRKCQYCGRESPLISQALGLCLDCIRRDFDCVFPLIGQAHNTARRPFGLPEQPPRADDGAKCQLCINECCIPINERGYCGLRTNREGKLTGASASRGNVSWYYDALPTNCVVDWVCPGDTGAGYPKFAYSRGAEHGYKNLAVFYQVGSQMSNRWQVVPAAQEE